MKFLKARKDYMKCRSVLASCENIGQVQTASNMIHNYGKVYGYNHRWSELDRKCWNYFREVLDRIEYAERLESIKDEQEDAEHPEGESV